jgi:mannose-6-phosphate isomerase-like protein (cupin superfamily)
MGYETASKTDAESAIPGELGGMWFLKGELSTDELGLTVLELDPGAEGKEHDHGKDGQEEGYFVAEGVVEFDVGDDTVSVGEDEALRVDATTTRHVRNPGDERAKLVIAGAPL